MLELLAASAAAVAFACAPVAVKDGDGLLCGPLRQEVRLARVDAPDHPKSRRCRNPRTRDAAWCDEAAFHRSKAALAELVDGRAVTCTLVDALPRRPGFQATDPYGRPVATCRAGRTDLGRAQLRSRDARVWR